MARDAETVCEGDGARLDHHFGALFGGGDRLREQHAAQASGIGQSLGCGIRTDDTTAGIGDDDADVELVDYAFPIDGDRRGDA